MLITIQSGVALFTRAWIEICEGCKEVGSWAVALFTRACIEIALIKAVYRLLRVALFTRAWIEIDRLQGLDTALYGRPLHEGVD